MPLDLRLREDRAELVLNDPPRNLLGPELLGQMLEALDRCEEAASPVLVLRAEGRHFSTGYPIDAIPEDIFHADASVRAEDPFQRTMDRLSAFPAPVMALIQGDAYGGAVELLSCADLRLGALGVRFAVPSARLGLVYSHSGLRRMASRLGPALTREMLLTGEPIDAERAHRAGFLNRLVPAKQLEAAGEEMLAALSRATPQALRGTRRLLNLLDERESLGGEELEEVARLRHESWRSEESKAARERWRK